MSTSDDQNWEDQWRKEIDRHNPLPTNEDWRGMNRMLGQNSPALAQQVVEQEPIGFDPWRSIKNRRPQLGWPIWIGLVLFVTALGIWLGLTHEEVEHQEMKATIIARDSFPPKYTLDRYWTYDKDGNRVGEMHSDTIWRDHHVRKWGTHVVLSPGRVSDYRIDTFLSISGRGDLLSVRYDTIVPSPGGYQETRPSGEDHQLIHYDCAKDIVYNVDTIYSLDSLGNLTDNIAHIDSTISYSPSVRNQ